MKHLRPSRKLFNVLSTLLLPLALVGSAKADLVANGSFEKATASITTQFLTAGVADWTNSGIGEALVKPSWYTNGYLFPPNVGLAGSFPQYSPDGGNFVLSDGDYMHSFIKQTIAGLTPGDAYQLSFYQALAQDKEPSVTTPGPVTGQWQVTLGASPVQLSTMMYADGSTIPSPSFSPWKQETMTFTAQYATEVLSFFSIGTGAPPMVGLDGVSLVASAPEPASLVLMGMMGAALLGCRFRFRRRSVATPPTKVF